MNKNIDLTKILKDCPKGTEFYSVAHGDIKFVHLLDLNKILFEYKEGNQYYDLVIQSNGKLHDNGECIVFPSKYCHDWSKFTAPWYKKEKFDPKTLQPFDKVLVRDGCSQIWRCDFLSYIKYGNINYPYVVISAAYKFCIPYNDDTKHLVGTTSEAPEYYRYWKD